jgi:hypothetical protein
MAERKNKIKKFVGYLQGVIDNSGPNSYLIEKSIKSSKCKIPWTDNDLREA